MRKYPGFVFGLLLLIGIMGMFRLSYAQEKQDLQALFQQAQQNYYKKDYVTAVRLFEEIRTINPNYRSTQIRRYIRTSETKIGKTGVKKQVTSREKSAPPGSPRTFKIEHEPAVKVQVKKEGEFESLSSEALRVLLDAYETIEQSKENKELSDYTLLQVESTLKMAQTAYEDNEFIEAVRLGNKARFQLINLINQGKKQETPILGKTGSIPVSLNLTDADLEQTLKLLYDLTGTNIVLSKGIEGRVTLNVKDIAFQKVLDLICESNDLKYVEQDGIILIMTEKEYAKRQSVQRALQRRVFPVLYGDASLIAKALKETFKMQTIVYDPRTNSIVVDVTRPEIAKQLEDVISALDSPISQVLLEARIIEVVTNDDDTLSVDWMITSRLIEKIAGGLTLTGPRFGDILNFTPGVTSTLPSKTFSFGITNNDINSLITALSTKGKVKLIQAPKIMTLNGTNAIISVTENYPYIIPEYEEEYDSEGRRTGTRQTVTVYEDQVGTEFMVTPIIQKNRTVFLNIMITDSRLIEIRTLKAIAADKVYETQQPIISTRETAQNVILFDGQTLVIGGMLQSDSRKNVTGVPFLSRIPILGHLFKHSSYSERRSEMLLFITPHIVTTYEEANELSRPDINKSDQKIEPGILKYF